MSVRLIWPRLFVLVCILGTVTGCGSAERITWPSPPFPKASMVPVEYAFTGYGGTQVNPEDEPIMYVREMLYSEIYYREARAVMEANGLDGFQSMVLLWVGGDERTVFTWAFKYHGTPYCVTSFRPEEITAKAKVVEGSDRELGTSVHVTEHEYEQVLASLSGVSGKGDAVVGEAKTFHHGYWAHVVAYDRDKGWFIRFTTVDPDVLAALDLLTAALGTFSPELSKDAVVARTERELAQGEQAKSTEECRRRLRIVEQNWNGCIPFLAAMHLVLPEPRWRRELRQEILNN